MLLIAANCFCRAENIARRSQRDDMMNLQIQSIFGKNSAGQQQKSLRPHDGGTVSTIAAVYGINQAAQHSLFLPLDS